LKQDKKYLIKIEKYCPFTDFSSYMSFFMLSKKDLSALILIISLLMSLPANNTKMTILISIIFVKLHGRLFCSFFHRPCVFSQKVSGLYLFSSLIP